MFTIAERNDGLCDDAFVAVQPGLDVDRVAVIATDDDVLQVELVLVVHDHDLRAGAIENQGGCGKIPAASRRRQLEVDVDEFPGKKSMGRIGNIQFRQERSCSRVQRIGRPGDGCLEGGGAFAANRNARLHSRFEIGGDDLRDADKDADGIEL